MMKRNTDYPYSRKLENYDSLIESYLKVPKTLISSMEKHYFEKIIDEISAFEFKDKKLYKKRNTLLAKIHSTIFSEKDDPLILRINSIPEKIASKRKR